MRLGPSRARGHYSTVVKKLITKSNTEAAGACGTHYGACMMFLLPEDYSCARLGAAAVALVPT